MSSFSDWCPALLFPHAGQLTHIYCIVTPNLMGLPQKGAAQKDRDTRGEDNSRKDQEPKGDRDRRWEGVPDGSTGGKLVAA